MPEKPFPNLSGLLTLLSLLNVINFLHWALRGRSFYA